MNFRLIFVFWYTKKLEMFCIGIHVVHFNRAADLFSLTTSP